MRGMTSEEYFGKGSPKIDVLPIEPASSGYVLDMPTYEEMVQKGNILKKENGDLALWYSPEISLYAVVDMNSGYRYGSFKSYDEALDVLNNDTNKYYGEQ